MKAVLGCVASLAYFAFVGLLMLGNMLGDCFPEMGHTCPTDHERNVAIVTIFLGGLVFYGLIAFCLTWLGKRLSHRDSSNENRAVPDDPIP